MTSDRLVPLSLITAPTLVVHGTEDPLRPLPHGEAVAVQIQHARMEVIPGMGGIRSCHRAFLAGSASSSWRIPNGARPK
jgi:fermentation-respiration switch protein FrsA (DUF1100 family)